jgi:hypothetical protein
MYVYVASVKMVLRGQKRVGVSEEMGIQDCYKVRVDGFSFEDFCPFPSSSTNTLSFILMLFCVTNDLVYLTVLRAEPMHQVILEGNL